MTNAPATTTYASIVSRETVKIALMITAINDLEAELFDILNVHIETPVTKKVWTTLGPEFSKDSRKTAVIVRGLHGLKLAGAAFISHVARCMESLGYKPCRTNLNLWLKHEIRPEDGFQYYSYLLYYVDDILYIYHNVDAVFQQLHNSFPLKLGFGKPAL